MQIFAATNGFLDRLNVERVPEFLAELTERMHSQAQSTREKIRGGDWSEETQEAVRKAVEEFARDFGYDLDEEGQPLDDAGAPVERRDAAEGSSDGDDAEGEGEGEGTREETTAAA